MGGVCLYSTVSDTLILCNVLRDMTILVLVYVTPFRELCFLILLVGLAPYTALRVIPLAVP